jgi:hypothetical protein
MLNPKFLIRMIYAKYNELEGLKKHIKDEHSLSIIEAKQATLNDIEKMLESIAYDIEE